MKPLDEKESIDVEMGNKELNKLQDCETTDCDKTLSSESNAAERIDATVPEKREESVDGSSS